MRDAAFEQRRDVGAVDDDADGGDVGDQCDVAVDAQEVYREVDLSRVPSGKNAFPRSSMPVMTNAP
ncbi:hypothetical protein QP162_13200 [Sphingomonas aurantiaca]|uniref:hypothetical protein n=1 Tax=Sphingomonas aurantiaca TaxID=185949 RepID=UPI002FDFD716